MTPLTPAPMLVPVPTVDLTPGDVIRWAPDEFEKVVEVLPDTTHGSVMVKLVTERNGRTEISWAGKASTQQVKVTA